MTPRIPARAWLRPALLVIGGLTVAAILAGLRMWWGAAAVAAAALFMGYWTSPVRGGQHVPFATAMSRRAPGHAIILWAPGDPLSARLQTAIRGERPDVTWVNVYQDAEADAFVLAHGGHAALPLVIIGDEILRRATMGRYLDARAEAADRGTGAGADRARAKEALSPEPWAASRDASAATGADTWTSADRSPAGSTGRGRAEGDSGRTSGTRDGDVGTASSSAPASGASAPGPRSTAAAPSRAADGERTAGPATPVDIEADRDALLPDDFGN